MILIPEKAENLLRSEILGRITERVELLMKIPVTVKDVEEIIDESTIKDLIKYI